MIEIAELRHLTERRQATETCDIEQQNRPMLGLDNRIAAHEDFNGGQADPARALTELLRDRQADGFDIELASPAVQLILAHQAFAANDPRVGCRHMEDARTRGHQEFEADPHQ